MSERSILIMTTVAIAMTRFLAAARTPWEWDETLFLHGMRDFNTLEHHPHPPGFPLFIAASKVMAALIGNDFRGLQAVALLASVAAFPVMFAMARAFGFDWRTSYTAGVLFTFFPNVWLFGGTAFSDVPSIVLALLSAALLARSDIGPRAFVLGCVALGCAVAFRPQNVLFAAPLVIASWRIRRERRTLLLGLAVLITIPAISFGAAAMATGSIDDYLESVRVHGEYISAVDSFRSPARPPLLSVAAHFVFKWHPFLTLGHFVTLLATVGLATGLRARSRPVMAGVATFAPFLLLAVLMLDRFSVTRFSIAYAPLFALLSAYGLARTVERLSRTAHAAVLAAIVVASSVWLMPGLRTMRHERAPAVAALHWVETSLSPRATVFVAEAMMPFWQYFVPQRTAVVAIDQRSLDMRDAGAPPAFLLAEGHEIGPSEAAYSQREFEGGLWKTMRGRYFRVFVQRMSRRALFNSDWSSPQLQGSRVTRTLLESEGSIQLPPSSSRSVLAISVAPAAGVGDTEVTVLFNGRQYERFTCSARVVRTLRVRDSLTEGQNVLTLRSSRRGEEGSVVISGVSFGPLRRRSA